MGKSLDQWVKRIGDESIPVMETTITQLNRLGVQDDIPVAEYTAIVERDPGLTVQLLRMCNSQRHGRLGSEITNVQQALMLLGTERIRRLPTELPILEKTLDILPRQQLLGTFSRAWHAAAQATDWARERRDMTPDEVHAATLLHFIGEMVLSLFAPDKVQEIYTLRNEEHVASAEAQYVVLGFTFDELALKLASAWKLPQLVTDALQQENAQFPRAYGIMLAVQLVRAGQYDWFGEKAQAIEMEVAEWLQQDLDRVVARAHTLAAEVARDSDMYGAIPAAVRLVRLPPLPREESTQEDAADENVVGLCLTPQLDVLKTLFGQLGQAVGKNVEPEKLLAMATRAMHDGIGLNRVVFARLNDDGRMLVAAKVAGADNDPIFNRFQINLAIPNLFSRLMERPQAIWMNDTNRNKYWSLVPVEVQKLLTTNSFFAMSVHVNGKPWGLFYADRHTSACQLDETSYKYFKTITSQTARALQRSS